jgi:hypothetical protein
MFGAVLLNLKAVVRQVHDTLVDSLHLIAEDDGVFGVLPLFFFQSMQLCAPFNLLNAIDEITVGMK